MSAQPGPKRGRTSAASSRSKPQLLVFHSACSGPSRRVAGYVAQVLQRRANNEAFDLRLIDADERPATARRFGVETMPTLVVIVDRHVEARLEASTGCQAIQAALARRWLA